MTGLTKKLVLILIPVLVLMIGLLCVLLFMPGGGEVYVKQISQARKLVENGDYQKAIVFYQNAIEEDGTKEEPYIELANVYFRLNMRNEAISILNEGFKRTNSMAIMDTLKQYEDGADAQVSDMEPLPVSGTVTFNSTFADVFSSYNYEKYSSEFTVKDERNMPDVYSVSYVQYDAVFEYARNTENPVVDPQTGKPYPFARPTNIRVNKLSQLIPAVETGVTTDQLKEAGASAVSFDEKHKQLTFEYKGMNITLGCDENGTVKGDDAFNSIVPTPGQGEVEEKVTVKGHLIDATTGKPVSGAKLKFHKGKNQKNGEVAAEKETVDGSYSVELDPGDYTIEITADGYNKEYAELYVTDSGHQKEETISISPTLASNEIRFVLEWGATPVDLDSHLEGDCKTEPAKHINISWFNRRAAANGRKIAELDLDDRNGYGPETTTLYDTNGSYEYKVHRFSHDGSLAMSGATVKIYTANSSTPIVVSVPHDQDGEWWTVCKVVDGQIRDINGVTS